MTTSSNRRLLSLLLCTVASSALYAAAPALAATNAKEASAAPVVIPEIVVTAQKRSQRLSDVPISITALSGEQLKSLQIVSGTDVARQTPNMRVSNLGNEDQPKFSIRGISTPDFNLNTTSPVGAFYDEVFVGAQWMGGPQIFDMERVEVLRGPQGTLFGKNTTGGAVDFIFKNPSFGPASGYIDGEYGNNSYYHFTGAAETQLIDDKLAVRLAFNVTESDGWVKNFYQSSLAKDLSSISNHAVRLTVAYRDTDNDFDATFKLISTNSNPSNIGVIVYGLNPDGTQADGVNSRVNPYTGQPFTVHQGAYDHSGEIKATGNGGYLTMNKGLGSNFTLTSVTSYFDGKFKNTVDADGSYVPGFFIDFYADQWEFTQDLRIASKFSGPFNFIVGGYYDGDRVAINTNYFTGIPPAPALPTTAVPLFEQSYVQKRRSYAFYADGTYNILSNWQLYAGLRWTNDHGEVNNFDTTVAAFVGAPGINVPYLAYNRSAVTGRVGTNYHITPDIMAYAQYSRGYRSPAFNGGALIIGSLNVAKAEFLDSYEAGIKSEFLDHRLQINASAFHYLYKNQQFLVATANFTSSQVNADAKSYGLELEATIRPVNEFDLSAGLGYLHAKYQSGNVPDPRTSVLSPISGNRTVKSPKLTMNLAGNYRVPVGDMQRLVFHMDANHATKEYFSPFNIPESATGSFWEANARLSYEDDDRNLNVSFWIKNLTGNTTPTGVVLNYNSQLRFTTIPYPRRYGVEVRYQF